MDDATRLRITQWRKCLERRGWVILTRGIPPRHRLIEYHVIWQGWLISGRVQLSLCEHAAWEEPGSPVYLLERGLHVDAGVWQFARDQRAQPGQVVRPAPAQ